MAFVKREIKDRVVQYPRRYQLVEVQPGIFDLIPVTGTVTEEGTPVNKELLQRYEDGLDAALEKTGDGKDVTVTFSEAATEAHIASGEKLSTLFGKILKKFKNVAPTSHASSSSTYGVGTTSNFGHCKTINNLTQASHVNGNALSAYQGKVLNDRIDNEHPIPIHVSGTIPLNAPITNIFNFDATKGYKNLYVSEARHGLYFIDGVNGIVSGFWNETSSVTRKRIVLTSSNQAITDDTFSGNSPTYMRKIGNTIYVAIRGRTTSGDQSYVYDLI